MRVVISYTILGHGRHATIVYCKNTNKIFWRHDLILKNVQKATNFWYMRRTMKIESVFTLWLKALVGKCTRQINKCDKGLQTYLTCQLITQLRSFLRKKFPVFILSFDLV